jgi:hypothetical protein
MQKTLELTYLSTDILNNAYRVNLKKFIGEDDQQLKNYVGQTYAPLFYGNKQVGIIFYYTNRIFNVMNENALYQNFENVVVKLFESPCFEPNTFASGELFYDGLLKNPVFDNNKEYSFKAISTGGSFVNKNVVVNIKTDNTPVRLVTITVNDFECKCI